jgi:Uncharacterised nucleotidyltransferase
MSAVLFPDLEAAVEASLYYGLATPASEALDTAAWTTSAVNRIVQFRLASHALALIDDHRVHIDDTLRAQLERGLFGQTINAMRLEGVVEELQQFLGAAGIASVALKGVALGDVQIPGCPRFYGDVDLLVSPRNFRRAIDLYRASGYSLEHPSPWNRLFAKSVNLCDAEGRAVDLQRAIAPWCWTRQLRFRSLLARGRTVAANRAYAIGVEDALITTALAHAADMGDDHEKLVPWRDLAILAPLVDQTAVVRIARRARVAPIVAVMLEQLPDALRPVDLIEQLGGAHIPLAKRPRWRVLTTRKWAQRYWFVRVTRNLPLSRLIPGIIALPILPPTDEPLSHWWRNIASVVLRKRAPVWQRTGPR